MKGQVKSRKDIEGQWKVKESQLKVKERQRKATNGGR